MTDHLPDVPELAARVPPDALAALRRYAIHHIPPGGFLAAVLANDLHDATRRADELNEAHLPAICTYIETCLPRASWGSVGAVRAWTKIRVV